MSNIERNRGALIRNHATGIKVIMYVDDPGRYFDATGEEVDESLAKQAGFDVNQHSKERQKLEMRKGFETTLEVMFTEAGERLERIREDNPEEALQLEIKEQNGQHVIQTKKGTRICDPTGPEEAALIYKHLTGKSFKKNSRSGGNSNKKAATKKQSDTGGAKNDGSAQSSGTGSSGGAATDGGSTDQTQGGSQQDDTDLM